MLGADGRSGCIFDAQLAASYNHGSDGRSHRAGKLLQGIQDGIALTSVFAWQSAQAARHDIAHADAHAGHVKDVDHGQLCACASSLR